MSDRERQRKFEAQARIKSSEFDRHNTNQTRQSSPTGRGHNLLPSDNRHVPTETDELLLLVASAGIGIAVFLLMMFLGKMILPQPIYAGVYFLLADLCLAVATAYIFYKLRLKA